jgi:hypothetical protein
MNRTKQKRIEYIKDEGLEKCLHCYKPFCGNYFTVYGHGPICCAECAEDLATELDTSARLEQ